MMFRATRLSLAGAAATLLLAAPIVAQEENPAPTEKKTFEKRIVIVGDHDDDSPFFEHMIADKYNDVDCQEENGKKICVARMGPMHFAGFPGTFLGVELTDSTPELREHLGAPRDGGVLVSRIQENSPAAEAGIEVGDIITAVDGEPVESTRDLRHAIASREAGATVKIDLYRDGRAEEISATLAKREPRDFVKLIGPRAEMLDYEALEKTIDDALRGLDLDQVDAQVRQRLNEVDWEKIKETIREALDESMEKEK